MTEPQTIVIKVGTNVLTDNNDELDILLISHIVEQIITAKQLGHRVILVSSGAVGAGKTIYTLKNVTDETISRQVYSSIGQVKLMNIYSEMFMMADIVCAQVLATKEDFIGLENYKNMVNCFTGLLLDDIIPIVNENDVVSLKELMFTDNDELAGLTAFMVKADKLIILTNVDGVAPNAESVGKKIIRNVKCNKDPKITFAAISSGGRGGMQSKIDVAIKMRDKGIEVHIANGKSQSTLNRIINGEPVGTRFEAKPIND